MTRDENNVISWSRSSHIETIIVIPTFHRGEWYTLSGKSVTSTLYMYNDLKNWFFIQVHYRHFKLPKSYYFIKIQLAKVKVVIFSLSHFVYIPFIDTSNML